MEPKAIECEILNTTEGARLLRMSEAKLRALASAGALCAFRVGPRWRFRRVDLERWAEQQALANIAPEVSGLRPIEG